MNINVKKSTVFFFLLVFISAAFSYAKGVKDVSDVSFNEIQGRFWTLEEVQKGSTSISIDRADVLVDIYNIKFESRGLRGAGAVNFYNAPYTIDGRDRLSIGRIASTRVGALYEMEDFTEYMYFQYLQKVDRWNFHDGKLKLHTYDENGAAVVLVFV